MSIIIRLQNLPWSANSADIRQFFRNLTIPDGGVHIVGGENGDAFIAFSSDEDARQAMLLDGGKIKDSKIKLLLSSRNEMQKVIEAARTQALNMQNIVQMAAAATSLTQPQSVPVTLPSALPVLMAHMMSNPALQQLFQSSANQTLLQQQQQQQQQVGTNSSLPQTSGGQAVQIPFFGQMTPQLAQTGLLQQTSLQLQQQQQQQPTAGIVPFTIGSLQSTTSAVSVPAVGLSSQVEKEKTTPPIVSSQTRKSEDRGSKKEGKTRDREEQKGRTSRYRSSRDNSSSRSKSRSRSRSRDRSQRSGRYREKSRERKKRRDRSRSRDKENYEKESGNKRSKDRYRRRSESREDKRSSRETGNSQKGKEEKEERSKEKKKDEWRTSAESKRTSQEQDTSSNSRFKSIFEALKNKKAESAAAEEAVQEEPSRPPFKMSFHARPITSHPYSRQSHSTAEISKIDDEHGGNIQNEIIRDPRAPPNDRVKEDEEKEEGGEEEDHNEEIRSSPVQTFDVIAPHHGNEMPTSFGENMPQRFPGPYFPHPRMAQGFPPFVPPRMLPHGAAPGMIPQVVPGGPLGRPPFMNPPMFPQRPLYPQPPPMEQVARPEVPQTGPRLNAASIANYPSLAKLAFLAQKSQNKISDQNRILDRVTEERNYADPRPLRFSAEMESAAVNARYRPGFVNQRMPLQFGYNHETFEEELDDEPQMDVEGYSEFPNGQASSAGYRTANKGNRFEDDKYQKRFSEEPNIGKQYIPKFGLPTQQPYKEVSDSYAEKCHQRNCGYDEQRKRTTTDYALNTCVLLSNIPPDVTTAEVKKFFGHIAVSGVKLVTEGDSDNVVAAYVKLVNYACKTQSFKLNRKHLRGFSVEISELSDEEYDDYRVKYPPAIKYLKMWKIPSTFREHDVKMMFSTSDRPSKITLVDDEESNGQIAFLQFDDPDTSRRVLEKKSVFMISGKNLDIEPCSLDEYNNADGKVMKRDQTVKQQQSETEKVALHEQKEENIVNSGNVGTGGPSNEEPDKCVIVRGLPPSSTTNENIVELFASAGVVPIQIHTLLDENGKPVGDVCCEFQLPEEAIIAVSKDKVEFHEKTISVELISKREMKRILEGLTEDEDAKPKLLLPLPTPSAAPLEKSESRGVGVSLPKFGHPGCVVGLENVPYRATNEDILEFFRDFSVSKENVIRRYNARGQPTGDARVNLRSPADAWRAVDVLNKRYMGRRRVGVFLAD